MPLQFGNVLDLGDEKTLRGQERSRSLRATIDAFVHEFRNIVGCERMNLALMKEALAETDVNGAVLRRFGLIQQQNRRLDRLLKDLDLLANHMPLQLEMSQLNELLESVGREWAEVARERHVGLRLFLDDRVPPTPLDWHRMAQVVTNLLKNAVEATPEGGTVWLESELRGARAVLRVKDAGPGLPDGLEIFEPYVSTKHDRSGLGLAISRTIVELHGGRMAAVDTRHGACFEVELPI